MAQRTIVVVVAVNVEVLRLERKSARESLKRGRRVTCMTQYEGGHSVDDFGHVPYFGTKWRISARFERWLYR